MRAPPRTASCIILCLAAAAGPRLPAAECEGFGDLPPAGEVPGPDCDQDGVPDECGIAGKFAFTAAKFSLGLGDPFLLASGDLDRDGDADLVSLDRTSEMALLLNTGDLDFEARRMDLPRASLAVAVADMDGDGLADVVLTGPSSLRVLRNAGDAVFRPPHEVSLSANPVTVAASDLDGDGAPDLAVAGRVGTGFDDMVSILTNDATGSFSAPRNFGVHRGVRWLAARDLDADGDLDLAVASDGHGVDEDDDRDGAASGATGPGAISILWNHGAGAFRPAETFDPGMFPGWIDAADIDEDGDGDLVVTGVAIEPWRHQLVTFRNSGGSFEPEVTIAAEGASVIAAVDDLDADGDPDLAAARPSLAAIELLANDGSGRFSGGRTTLATGLAASLLAADLDRDGDRDLAVAGHGPVALSLLRNDGGLSFGRRRDLAAGSDPRSVDAVDLDRDGDLDLAVTSSVFREVTFFWNDGAPDFRRATFHVLSGEWVELELVDLDLDGHVDIAAASNALRVEWGEGPGRFGAVLELPGPEWLRSLEPGDLDRDGRPDIAGAGTGRILIYSNAGGRAFAPPRAVVTGSGPRAVDPVDLDGDGDLDLAAALESTAVQVCRNDGTGAFEALPRIALGVAQPTSIGSADLDLDGAPDLMVPTMSPNVTLLWNRGATFDVTSSGPLPWASPFASAIDLDGDGDPEVVTTGFHILDNRAGLEGGNWLMLSRADMPARIAAADLDGNGLSDLISFTGSRSAIVLLNSSSPPAEPDVDRDGIPDGCERASFHRGDALPDGKIDLADAVSLLGFLFLGGEPLPCAEAADADNDGAVVVSDAIRILGFLFLGGPAPASPGPVTEPCGPDPDPAGSAGDLGCASYPPCG